MATKLFKYESDLDTNATDGISIIGTVRCSDLSTGLTIAGNANVQPEADLNSNIPIRVSSTRKYGIIARHIVLKRFKTDVSPNRAQIVRVVIFSPGVFISYISGVGEVPAYNGFEDWQIIGAENERLRLFLSPIS